MGAAERRALRALRSAALAHHLPRTQFASTLPRLAVQSVRKSEKKRKQQQKTKKHEQKKKVTIVGDQHHIDHPTPKKPQILVFWPFWAYLGPLGAGVVYMMLVSYYIEQKHIKR